MPTTLAKVPIEAGLHLAPVSGPETEIRFAHLHRAALLVGLAAGVGTWGAWTLIEPMLGRVVLTAIAALIAAQAIGASTYRYHLTFDPEARTWRRRMGRMPTPSTASGSMNDLKAVVLTMFYETRSSGGSRHQVPRWRVSLELEGEAWTEPLIVGIAKEEEEGYRLLESYARRLRVDAADRTGDEEVRRGWQDLDRTAADLAPYSAADSAADSLSRIPGRVPGGGPPAGAPAPPPAASGIALGMEDGRPRITLPSAGKLPVQVVQVAFGLIFAGGAGFMAWSAFTSSLSGDRMVVVAVTAGLALMGLRIAFGGMRAIGGREWVLDRPDELLFGRTGPFGTSRRSSVAKREVEEVVAVTAGARGGGSRLTVLGMRVPLGSNAPGQEGYVRVRSDRAVVYLGEGLLPGEREWLRAALVAMVADRTGGGSPG